MIRCLVFLLLLAISNVHAQQNLEQNYLPIDVSGSIPFEFVSLVKSKFNEYEKKEVKKSDSWSTAKQKRAFISASATDLTQVLQSGRVTFNNEIHVYLQKIVDRLLYNNSELRSEIRVYPISFENSNAFAYNEGALFVHIGLIARCNNEAELAFVLAHEIAHYHKKHSILRAMEQQRVKKNKKQFKKDDKIAGLKAIRQFSRNNELEADLYGYELIKQAGYNPYATVTSLRGLEKANQSPLAPAEFNLDILEKGTFVIPDIYKKKLSGEIPIEVYKARKDEDDEFEEALSTHPAIDVRVEAILNKLSSRDSLDKPYYLVSEKTFRYARELCMMELCRIYLIENDLSQAFYHINILLQKYPNNTYLKTMMAHTLFRLAYSAHTLSYKRNISAVEKHNNSLLVSNNLIRLLNKEELWLLSLRYTWDIYQAAPSNSDVNAILREIIKAYKKIYNRSLSDFASVSQFSRNTINSFYSVDTTINNNTVKKTKINKSGYADNNYKYSFSKSLSVFALSDIVHDEGFVNYYNLINTNPDMVSVDELDQQENIHNTRVIEQSKKRIKSLGINHLILFEPEYYKLYYYDELKTNNLYNEKRTIEINNKIRQVANSAGMELALISASEFNENDIDKFQEYIVLRNWIEEYFNSSNRLKVPQNISELDAVKQKYGTNHIALLISLNSIEKNPLVESLLKLVLGVLYWPYLIDVISNFSKNKEFSYVLLVIDVDKNQIAYSNYVTFDMSDNNTLLKSQFYGMFKTMKSNKTK